MPTDSRTVRRFIAFQHDQNISPKTGIVYIAAIRKEHVNSGCTDPCIHDGKLKFILKGWCRTTKINMQIRRPITYSTLKLIKQRMRTECTLSGQDKLMLWSAFTLAYYGFLRVSEYTTTSRNVNQASLLLSDLILKPGHLLLLVRKDKTNQCGFPICLKLKITLKSCCPVRAFIKYCHGRTKSDQHSICFVFEDGKFLTRQNVNYWLKVILGGGFSSHSFRIGAATSAQNDGWTTEQIRTAGRWKSNVYMKYIRQ